MKKLIALFAIITLIMAFTLTVKSNTHIITGAVANIAASTETVTIDVTGMSVSSLAEARDFAVNVATQNPDATRIDVVNGGVLKAVITVPTGAIQAWIDNGDDWELYGKCEIWFADYEWIKQAAARWGILI